MKKQAYLYKSYDSPIINIDEAARRKTQLPDKWETWTYYDIVNLSPMVATIRTKKESSFTFKNNGSRTNHGNGSMGIAHALVQQYLCKAEDSWSFKIYGKTFNIIPLSVEEEYHIIDPETGKDRYIDCMIHLSEHCKHYNTFGGKIGVEVTDTSKTSKQKINTFKRLNLNVLELKTLQGWHIDNKPVIEEHEVKLVRARIQGFLNKAPSLSKLHLNNMI